MMFNYRSFDLNFLILFVTLVISPSAATWCHNLTLTDDNETPCFLESPRHNPIRFRSLSNSLVLPCHVAHSKSSTIEWWYQDFQNTINIKIYPVFPAVRPTVVRFITSVTPASKTFNTTDTSDVSVMLRHVNVDDSGIYQCVIRQWPSNEINTLEDKSYEYNSHLPTLSYHVELTSSRLCQTSLAALPCFADMRTSSPTIIDAYQTAFLQCIVQKYRRPIDIFWVVGNASANSVLITDHLTTNQHKGDRLRRVFPFSSHDFSIELSIDHDTHERSYSCVINGMSDIETTLFTYTVRSINAGDNAEQTSTHHKNQTLTKTETEPEPEKTNVSTEKLVPHDVLTPAQIDELRQHSHHKHSEITADDTGDEVDLNKFARHEETSTTI